MHSRQRSKSQSPWWVALGVGGVVTLALTACAGGGPSDSGSIEAVEDASGLECDAVEIGLVTRCENFYTDYWPVINANLDALHEEALKTDGGRVVIWDWDALDKERIDLFSERFPGLTMESEGMNFNLSTAVLAAQAAGERNSDIVRGTLVTTAPTYDAGLWQKIDWAEYGVPAEFLTIGGADTGMLPDSVNGAAFQYNTEKVTAPPASLDELADPKYQGMAAITDYNAQDFSGYGMRHGEEAMVSLIEQLKAGNLTITGDTNALLSSGDKPIVIAGQLHDGNPALSITPYEDSNLYLQYTGVNTDAKNAPGAILFALWNAFDPEWIKVSLTDPAYENSSQVFPGLPIETLEQATGLQKINQEVWWEAMGNGMGEIETIENRDEYLAMIAAANTALAG